MIIINNKSHCTGCTACVTICPKSCIVLEADDEGFMYPRVMQEMCVDCGLCEKVCPVDKKIVELEKDSPCLYAAYHNNEKIRHDSSSGGIFSAIAEKVIEEGGTICGCVCDGNKLIKHTFIHKVEDLHKLRGSKYVQSSIEGVFSRIKEYLLNNTPVLFCGTPCQVAGLISFVPAKLQERLYTIDFICHGVPSPKVWDKYVKWQETVHNSHITDVSFRSKIKGWTFSHMVLEFENSEQYSKSLERDKYLRGFLNDVTLRPSCYECSFKTVNRVSDLTLADFWGIKKVDPSMYRKDGVSLVLVQSKKGESLMMAIDSKITKKEEPLEKVTSININLQKSVVKPTNRELFFANIDKYDYKTLYSRFLSISMLTEMKFIIRNMLKQLLFSIGR